MTEKCNLRCVYCMPREWLAWLKKQDASEVSAREPGGGVLKPIEDAPGSYVKVRD